MDRRFYYGAGVTKWQSGNKLYSSYKQEKKVKTVNIIRIGSSVVAYHFYLLVFTDVHNVWMALEQFPNS